MKDWYELASSNDGPPVAAYKAGDRLWFEYHCSESPDSEDAILWYHSHQQCVVLHQIGWDQVDYEVGPMYRIRFDDGVEWDVGEDELGRDTSFFERADPPKPPTSEAEISRRADTLLNRLLKEKVSDHDLAPEYDLGDGYKLSFVGGQWYNNAYREGEFLTPDGTVAGTLFLGHRVSNDLLPPWWVDAVEIYDQFRGHGLFRRALMALRRDINITSDIRGHSSEPAIKAWKSVGGAELKKRPRFSARPLYMLRRKAQP